MMYKIPLPVSLVRKFVSAILALLISFNFFVSVAVYAENESHQSASVDVDRFLTNTVTAHGGELFVTDEGHLELVAKENTPSLTMDITPLAAQTKANSLRIVLENDSECESVGVVYSYKNSANISQNDETRFSIKPNTSKEKCEYIVPLKSPDTMTKLTLNFHGIKSGKITVISIGAVSEYNDNVTYYGNLLKAEYDPNSKKAVFSGEIVSHETFTQNRNALIVLYKLNASENISDVRYVHPYIASCGMTLTFRFDLVIENEADVLARYFAAILTTDNNVIPLTADTYLQSTVKVDLESKDNIGFKGLETELYSFSAENGSAVAFVDVFLDDIISDGDTGYQYVIDGYEYYFDRDRIRELDNIIRSHSNEGSDVYLRFLVSSDNAEAEYLAITPNSAKQINDIFAVSDFIVSHYKDYKNIKGIILGRSLDLVSKYNYCDVISVSEYSEMIVRTCMLFEKAMEKNSVALEIILPVSDSMFGKEYLVTAESRDESYPTDRFISSVVKCLDKYGTEISNVYFMLESTHSPFSVSCDTETSCVPIETKYINASNCQVFKSFIKDLSNKYPELNEDVFFCYIPSAEMSESDFVASYVYNYNILAGTKGIRSFILSVFEREDETGLFDIQKEYKYIDTDTTKSREIEERVLASLGASKWEELSKNYDPSLVGRINFIENNLEYTKDMDIKGTYCLWDFSTSNGTLDWLGADGCDSLSVHTLSVNENRALVAYMLNGEDLKNGAMYGSIIYKAPDTLSLKDVKSLSFDIFIPHKEANDYSSGPAYEIIVKIVGDGMITESRGRAFAGQKETVFANIDEMSDVEYIKLSVRRLDVESDENYYVCIDGISIHSELYTSNELEEIVLSGEIGNTSVNNTDVKDMDSLIISFAVIATSLIVVIAVWIVYSYKKKKAFDERF